MNDRFEARGIAACLGVAIGPAFVLPRPGEVQRRLARDPELEQARLRAAIEASRAEIEAARGALEAAAFPGELGEAALVLDAQLLMHRDELLVDATARRIDEEGVGAEWALMRTVEALQAPLLASRLAYFRERAEDIAHVGAHILRHLEMLAPTTESAQATESEIRELGFAGVLIAQDLSPADAARLLSDPDSRIQAFVTEAGSATSHTALLARALGVPAVMGIVGVVDATLVGDLVVVDGLRGTVIVRPDEEERCVAEERRERYRRFTQTLRARGGEPVALRDGEAVAIRANVELPGEVAAACAHGAAGIGLFRTEFLYLDRSESPSEAEQAVLYAEVLAACPDDPVCIRTFDLGGDKLPRRDRLPPSLNPALGLRAFRLALRRPEVLRAQVRAVLRAAARRDRGPVTRLMFPLVSGVEELRQAKAFVRECRRELEEQGCSPGRVALGAMIEVPSAALMSDAIAAEVDFLSVGTNDLVQYTMAVDRGNPEVAHLAQSIEPAVLRLLDRVQRAAAAAEVPLTMCGDMAADPIALPLVLGLGYRVLSVPVAELHLVQEVIRRLEGAETRAFATEALAMPTASAVRRALRFRFGKALQDLWVERGVTGASQFPPPIK